MTKAWCIWCEMGQMPPHGYYWIHPECFENMHNIGSNIEMVEKYMKGEMPRILANGNKQGYESVERFLVEMEDFNRRSRNILKLFKAHREGIPLDQVQFETSQEETKLRKGS